MMTCFGAADASASSTAIRPVKRWTGQLIKDIVRMLKSAFAVGPHRHLVKKYSNSSFNSFQPGRIRQ